MVVEPVRRAVIVLVNKLNRVKSGGGGDSDTASLRGGNSLPDVRGGDELMSPKPPMLPKRPPHEHHHHRHHHTHRHHHRHKCRRNKSLSSPPSSPPPPPLPPKHNVRVPVDLTDLGGGRRNSSNSHGADWFSNPLFDQPPSSGRPSGATVGKMSLYETSFIDSQLPSPRASLDTTLPDNCNFPFMDEVG